jgi:hypothetical protein
VGKSPLAKPDRQKLALILLKHRKEKFVKKLLELVGKNAWD